MGPSAQRQDVSLLPVLHGVGVPTGALVPDVAGHGERDHLGGTQAANVSQKLQISRLLIGFKRTAITSDAKDSTPVCSRSSFSEGEIPRTHLKGQIPTRHTCTTTIEFASTERDFGANDGQQKLRVRLWLLTSRDNTRPCVSGTSCCLLVCRPPRAYGRL